jgi:hypothetical protein
MELIIFTVVLVLSNAFTAFITLKVVQTIINANKQLTEGKEVEIKGPIAMHREKVKEKKVEEEIKKAQETEHERLQSWIGVPDYLEAFKEGDE